MSKIKTRETLKGVKVLDKTSVASERIKSAFIRSKEQVNENTSSKGQNANEYAAEKISGAIEDVVDKTGDTISSGVDKVTGKAKDLYTRNREIRGVKEQVKQTKNPNSPTSNQSPIKKTTPKTRSGNNKYIKTFKQPQKTIRQSSKSLGKSVKKTGKYSIKGSKDAIKGVKSGAKVTIKTAQQVAKTAQTTIKASQRAYQIAKLTAKATVTAIKLTIKATIAAVKAIIIATKALISAIIAGGWIAVLIIILICLIGLIISSCFGIFFSGEDTGSGQTMRTAVSEINTDYQEEIDNIKSSHFYDTLEMSGSRAVWREVLAVYSVNTTTDTEAPTDVSSMDDSKKKILEDVFWEMNDISSYSKTSTYTEIILTEDGEGGFIEEEVEREKTTLYIQVSHKTVVEMSEQYSFTDDEKELLEELLSDEYSSLWSQILYGINSSSEDIVAVALSQVGNVGGEKFWSWYGFDYRVEWCACFVSWCANELGYVEAGIIPKFAACTSQGMPWFKERGQWQDRYYEPRAGDIIFFVWDGSNDADHVGIVEKCENGIVYTIEGNSGDMCQQRQYSVGSSVIHGYGVPAY